MSHKGSQLQIQILPEIWISDLGIMAWMLWD